jgi:hypothetical protein
MSHKNNNIKENIQRLLLRLELWFAPLLIIIPLVVSLFFVQDWYTRGFSTGSSEFDGELLIGMIILIGNILVDIPFLRSIRMLRKKE